MPNEKINIKAAARENNNKVRPIVDGGNRDKVGIANNLSYIKCELKQHKEN